MSSCLRRGSKEGQNASLVHDEAERAHDRHGSVASREINYLEHRPVTHADTS